MNEWWKKEFYYLLNRKILLRDELGYLFSQIRSIIEIEKNKSRNFISQALNEGDGVYRP
jgi:hypothetical protein